MRLILALTMGIFVLSLVSSSRAQEKNPLIIMIAPRSEAEQVKPFLEVISDEVSDLPATLHAEWVNELSPDIRIQSDVARRIARDYHASAVFWADFSRPHEIFLFISQQDGQSDSGRLLVRNLPAESAGIEARIEAVALIVRASIKAFLEGGSIGVQPPPPAPSVPTSHPSSVDTEKPSIIDAFAAYVLTGYSGQRVPVLHGGRFGLQIAVTNWLRLGAAYRFQLPAQMRTEYVELELAHHPVELEIASRWRKKRLMLESALGLLLDQTSLSAKPRTNIATNLNAEAPFIIALSPSIRLGWRPGLFATIYAAVGLDIVLKQTELMANIQGEEPQPLLKPWSIRPHLQVGAIFAIL